jgi:broad specificity phosphatase PhoE
MLRLILVRHGQTEANLRKILQGQSDGPLTALGLQQAERLAIHLKNFHIDQIYSSDLSRASDTAAAIAKYHHIHFQTSPLLREWNGGELDGQPAEVFKQLVQTLKSSNNPLSAYRARGGETLIEVRQRAGAFLQQLITNNQGQTVLVCSHGDFLRMLMSVILKKDADEAETSTSFFLDNASFSIFKLDGDQWKIIAFNQLPPQ